MALPAAASACDSVGAEQITNAQPRRDRQRTAQTDIDKRNVDQQTIDAQTIDERKRLQANNDRTGMPVPLDHHQATAPASAAAGHDAITAAETLLFQTDHLRNVRRPATLRYQFRRTGSRAPAFDDQVTVQLDGGGMTSMVFLTAERQRAVPEVQDAAGNPVLLGFLERDIAEMHRLTGGSSSYFRKRIRLALAAAAQPQSCRLTVDGAVVRARVVNIAPYRDDPMQERFGPFAGKRYRFIVGPDVPGGIYQIRTTVPGTVSASMLPVTATRPAGPDAVPPRASATSRIAAQPPTPMIEETLTLVGVEPPTNAAISPGRTPH